MSITIAMHCNHCENEYRKMSQVTKLDVELKFLLEVSYSLFFSDTDLVYNYDGKRFMARGFLRQPIFFEIVRMAISDFRFHLSYEPRAQLCRKF